MTIKRKTRWRACFCCQRSMRKGQHYVVMINKGGRQYRISACCQCFDDVSHILLSQKIKAILAEQKVSAIAAEEVRFLKGTP